LLTHQIKSTLETILQDFAATANKIAKKVFNKSDYATVLAGDHGLEKVNQILASLREEVHKSLSAELSRMLTIKKTRFADPNWRKTAFEAGFKLPLGENPTIDRNDLKVEGMDLLHYSHANLHETTSTYPLENIRDFFPISRCLEGLNTLAKDMFNVELRPSKRGEGGYTEWKRVEVVRDGNVIGDIYLDLFHRSEKPALVTSFSAEPRSVMISLDLDNNMIGRPSRLTMEQFRQLAGYAGVALAYITTGHSLSSYEEKIVASTFERACHNEAFLKSFAKHKGTHVQVFDQYVQQTLEQDLLVGTAIQLLSKITYAQFELDLFRGENFKTTENKVMAGNQVIPDLKVFTRIGDISEPLYEDIFAKLVAAQVYKTHQNNLKELGRALSGKNLSEITQGISDIYRVDGIVGDIFPRVQ
jgi:hypothetical protein